MFTRLDEMTLAFGTLFRKTGLVYKAFIRPTMEYEIPSRVLTPKLIQCLQKTKKDTLLLVLFCSTSNSTHLNEE